MAAHGAARVMVTTNSLTYCLALLALVLAPAASKHVSFDGPRRELMLSTTTSVDVVGPSYASVSGDDEDGEDERTWSMTDGDGEADDEARHSYRRGRTLRWTPDGRPSLDWRGLAREASEFGRTVFRAAAPVFVAELVPRIVRPLIRGAVDLFRRARDGVARAVTRAGGPETPAAGPLLAWLASVMGAGGVGGSRTDDHRQQQADLDRVVEKSVEVVRAAVDGAVSVIMGRDGGGAHEPAPPPRPTAPLLGDFAMNAVGGLVSSVISNTLQQAAGRFGLG